MILWSFCKSNLRLNIFKISAQQEISKNTKCSYVIIYGYEYINYSWLLKVLSIIYILNSLSICIKCFSISLKEIKIINLVYFVTNASSVLLGYFLIDRYKLYGAGIGLLLTQTLNTSIYFYWWILKNKNFNSNKLNTNS